MKTVEIPASVAKLAGVEVNASDAPYNEAIDYLENLHIRIYESTPKKFYTALKKFDNTCKFVDSFNKGFYLSGLYGDFGEFGDIVRYANNEIHDNNYDIKKFTKKLLDRLESMEDSLEKIDEYKKALSNLIKVIKDGGVKLTKESEDAIKRTKKELEKRKKEEEEAWAKFKPIRPSSNNLVKYLKRDVVPYDTACKFYDEKNKLQYGIVKGETKFLKGFKIYGEDGKIHTEIKKVYKIDIDNNDEYKSWKKIFTDAFIKKIESKQNYA